MKDKNTKIEFEFELPEHLMLNKKDEKDLRKNWPRLKSWIKIFLFGILIGIVFKLFIFFIWKAR